MKSVEENIKKYGWQFQFVFDPEGIKEEFSYSIGFEESYSHPEIMIFGLKRESMHGILSEIALEIKSGKIFEEGIRYNNVLSGEYEVCFKPVKDEHLPEYAGVATRYYKKPIRVLVMFWPDKANVLPIEPNCTLTVQNEALKIV